MNKQDKKEILEEETFMYEEKVKSENRPQEKQINRLRPECLSCTCLLYTSPSPRDTR